MHHQISGGATTYAVSKGTVTAIVFVIASAIVLQLVSPETAETAQEHWIAIACAVLTLSIGGRFAQLVIAQRTAQPPALPKMFVPIPFTEKDLAWYDGVKNSTASRVARGDATAAEEYDLAGTAEKLAAAVAGGKTKLKHPLPLYDNLVFVGVKGVVYNVSPEYYGPGAGYSAFAAKDSSRQLGKVIVGSNECNVDWTTMNDKHVKVLGDWEARYRDKYCIAGWIVPEDREYFTKAKDFGA